MTGNRRHWLVLAYLAFSALCATAGAFLDGGVFWVTWMACLWVGVVFFAVLFRRLVCLQRELRDWDMNHER